ncbi:hypothetical protein KIN20_019039 [Parelaphostrongylus tenuis]|uniref:Uncharacterized protein n=1 Tax=Parelaphostrongylus tenuis TaxID=148309 RepID=A0AAD5N869_PARTN|nr:hypothetical protein KIN20_019039 [Parelaphostrongylus tenuis]
MNGKLKYKNSCVRALLKDSLTVMSLKEIRLNMDVGKGPDSEDDPPEKVVALAKKMVTEAFQKVMIGNVMPSLLDLRVYLNEKRSPLRSELYAVFRANCRENKEQINEFLDGDRQLKAEVEHDIRRYEQRIKSQWAAAKKRAERSARERRRSRRSLAAITEINNANGAPSHDATVDKEQSNRNDDGWSLQCVDPEETQSSAPQASDPPNDPANEGSSAMNVKEIKQEFPDNTTRILVDETGAVNPCDVPSATEEELLQVSSVVSLPSDDGEKLEALPEEDRSVDVTDAHIAGIRVLLSPTGNEEPDPSTEAHTCEVEPRSERDTDLSPKTSRDVNRVNKDIDPFTPSNDKGVPEKENFQESVAEKSVHTVAPPPSNSPL